MARQCGAFQVLAAACTASLCFGLAILDQVLMPGPPNAPIEKMISSPGAAWLMFAFGVTIAPFFEEMFFRGFLLPALCTACDWIAEKMRHTLPRPLDANGHPQWSIPAMIAGSVPPAFLLPCCTSTSRDTPSGRSSPHRHQHDSVRGAPLTRSLAASTLVHAIYNFFIFAVTLIGTGGFRHFDKM